MLGSAMGKHKSPEVLLKSHRFNSIFYRIINSKIRLVIAQSIKFGLKENAYLNTPLTPFYNHTHSTIICPGAIIVADLWFVMLYSSISLVAANKLLKQLKANL